MILGEVICAIGTGLLMTVSLGTPTAHWASFLATTGLGLGMGMQMPYTAIQVVLRYVCNESYKILMIDNHTAREICL